MCKGKGRGIGLTWSLHPFSDRLERTHGIWDFELGRCCVEMHYGTFFRDAITSVVGHHEIALETGGAFHSAKTSGLNFRQLPGANGTAFSKISKNRATSRGIPKFSNVFSPEVFFPVNFAPGKSTIFGWMAPISEIQQFPEFLETFPGNFCTICRHFQILESFGWIESALGLNSTRHCPSLSRDLKWPFSTEFAISFLGELGLWKLQWMWLTLPR